MNFEKAYDNKDRIKELYKLNSLIKEVEEIYNSLDKESKNILKFNYIGREVAEYNTKDKNGRFWFNDAMIFRRKYFLFGKYTIRFLWACSYTPDLYQYNTDLSKLNIKSINYLINWLERYKKDISNLNIK